MAKQNIGQLVYTLEIEDQKAVRALQTFETKAVTSSRTVASHFDKFDKTTIKAQKSLLGLASAADLLGGSISKFVFGGIRAIDLITSLSAASTTASTNIKSVAKELNNLNYVQRALGGEIAAKANEPIARLRRGAGGRFESIPGSAAAAAARTGSVVSTADLQALAVGPTIEKSALAAQKASSAMTALGRAATLAGAGVAALAAGFKALFFTPVGAAILVIAGALAVYEHISNKAAEADEKRKKAVEAATEAHKKQLAVLEEIRKSAIATAPGEPGGSAQALRASRAEGLGSIAQINAGAAGTALSIANQKAAFEKDLRTQQDNLESIQIKKAASTGQAPSLGTTARGSVFFAGQDGKTLVGQAAIDAFNEASTVFARRQKEISKASAAEVEVTAAIARTKEAIANLEQQSGVEELNRARKVSEESQKAKDAFERGIASLQEGITSLPGRLSEGIKREQARIKNERNERVTSGLGTEADIIAFARERGNEQKAQDELKKSVKALVDRGEFGSLGKVISKVFGLDEDAKPIDAPAGTSRRFSSSGILGSSVGGFTRADVLGSGRTPEDEQVSLLTQIASVLTKIERKQIVGLQP